MLMFQIGPTQLRMKSHTTYSINFMTYMHYVVVFVVHKNVTENKLF